ncbi:MAG: hypothetical protein EA420_02985 [Candidatus Competibacteraceae bacterium]|nr:MAG: hypothetical protein EA420_02985 [Candidatus Competibacteraceae bacterium]
MRRPRPDPLAAPPRPRARRWLPLLLVLALGPVLDPAPAARAQSLIDELKGPRGAGVRSDDVPAGRDGWTFGIGTGADTEAFRPATFSTKARIDARFSAGFGYSCGAFDPFDNVEAMIESAIEKFQQLPQRFVNAAQAAVAGLPAYLLNKINPSLYNVVTKGLDEAFKLFEINFKDCQQIEREIALGQNPYHSLVMAGIGDRMRLEMGFGAGTIDERMQRVRAEGPANGVVMSEGRRYGGEGQDPIEPTRNVLTAGINLLVDRRAGDTSPFSQDPEQRARHPITQEFASPDALVAFATELYGSQAFVLTRDGPTRSTPGIGYPQRYVALRDETIDRLQQYVGRRIDRAEFERRTDLLIPPATIDEMRELPPYALSIAIDDQARLHAVARLRRQFDFALQAIRAGLKEPNLATSEAYEVIEREMFKLAHDLQSDSAHLSATAFLR